MLPSSSNPAICLIDGLRPLDDSILSEVVREGEARVLAQLEAANASDQRAMAWAGFVVTVTVAGLGGALTAWSGNSRLIACIGILFAVLNAVSAINAIDAAWPSPFSFPGNEPENWLPENWTGGSTKPFTQKRALLEQAACLQSMIRKNSDWAKASGDSLKRSMSLTLTSVVLCGLLLGLAVPIFGLRL